MDNKAIRSDNMDNARHIGGTVKEVRDSAQNAKERIEHGGNRLLTEARDFIEENTPDYVKESLVSAQAMAKRALDKSETVMRQNLWYSIFGAAGVGLIAGALLFRSRRND